MKKKYIVPIIKYWWKEFSQNFIYVGICGWALFGFNYLVRDFEWLGCILFGLVFVAAIFDTIAATKTTIKKDSQEEKSE